MFELERLVRYHPQKIVTKIFVKFCFQRLSEFDKGVNQCEPTWKRIVNFSSVTDSAPRLSERLILRNDIFLKLTERTPDCGWYSMMDELFKSSPEVSDKALEFSFFSNAFA